MNTVNAMGEAPVPKAVLHAIFVVFLLNVLFLLVAIYVASWSTRNLETNAKSAFARGDLVDQVFLTDDTQRGVNQYSDCVVEQLAITDSPNLLEKALAPKLMPMIFPKICASPLRANKSDCSPSVRSMSGTIEASAIAPAAWRYSLRWRAAALFTR
jgi:hypothetical protein